jgi:hypothetical protein
MEYPNVIFCGHCGRASPSMIQISGSYSGVTLQNNQQQCGHCGKMTRLPEGVFSSIRAAVDVLAGDENPIGNVDTLARALGRVQKWHGYDVRQLEELFEEAGIKQSKELALSAPKEAKDQKLWGATLLAAIAYSWEKLPQGANSWIELFENVRTLMGP